MKPAKSYLTENEAAEFLGVSSMQLRTLIRSHVTTEESDMSKVGMTQFQPADLLLLRFLIGQARGECATVETAQLAQSVAPEGGEVASVSSPTESALPATSSLPELVNG